MEKRSIELTAAPPKEHWVGDGFRVHNFFLVVIIWKWSA